MPVYHVRPHPSGWGWYIAYEDSPWALQTFRRRPDAIREARRLRGREPGEVRVYGRNGLYQYSETAPWLDDD